MSTDEEIVYMKSQRKSLIEQAMLSSNFLTQVAEDAWDTVEETLMDCKDGVVELKEIILQNSLRSDRNQRYVRTAQK